MIHKYPRKHDSRVMIMDEYVTLQRWFIEIWKPRTNLLKCRAFRWQRFYNCFENPRLMREGKVISDKQKLF